MNFKQKLVYMALGCLFTLISYTLATLSAAAATVSVSPPSVQSPAIGEPLTLTLKIADGKNVAGYQATVEFDPSALRYVSSANGDFFPTGSAFFVPPVVDGNRVTIAASAINAVSNGDGTLATITFEVVQVKASTITLSEVALVDSAGELSHPQTENGAVTEPPQLVGDVNNDGVVNIQDLVIVGANFGKTGQNKADVNGDGVVNILDLVMVADAFGQTADAVEVVAPDNTAPTIAKKNFNRRDTDPDPLNKDGVIIEFSEPIAKHSLKLTLEDGTDLGWTPWVNLAKITFQPLKGKELGNETTYIVQGEVFDAAGNKTDVKETFVTKGKE